jgi:hypothetical protein
MESHKHTRTQARKIGAYKALKYTLIVFLAVEARMLYLTTRGDFANGILFFMQEQMNSLALSIIFLLFLCAFVLGRWAGIKILMDEKSHVLMALLFAFLSWGILIGYLFLLSSIGAGLADWKGPALSMFLVSLIIWVATGWSIKRARA